MNEKFDEISDSLDIEVQAGEIVKETKQQLKQISKQEDHIKDYEYTRGNLYSCLLYTSPSPRDLSTSRMPSSA